MRQCLPRSTRRATVRGMERPSRPRRIEVFISYSSDEGDVAVALADRLRDGVADLAGQGEAPPKLLVAGRDS